MVVKITKSICFGVISFLVLISTAWTGPFLVCDPQVGVLEYEVSIEENGVPVRVGIVPAEADTTLKFDLAGIPDGTYIAKAKARNIWEWSEWSVPFGFVVAICNPPTNLSIVP